MRSAMNIGLMFCERVTTIQEEKKKILMQNRKGKTL